MPLAVWLILDGRLTSAFWLFVAAGLSDAVDGTLAKYLHAETTLGKFLDPLADKALLVSVYVALGRIGEMDTWLVILVVSRDIMIVGGVIVTLLTVMRTYKVTPSFISKTNTAAQILLAAVDPGPSRPGPRRHGGGARPDLSRRRHDARFRGVVSCDLVSADGGIGRTEMSPGLHLRFWLITLVVVCLLLYLLRGALLPFVAGMAIAYFLDPAADRLEKWGCSRTLATTIITLAFALDRHRAPGAHRAGDPEAGRPISSRTCRPMPTR